MADEILLLDRRRLALWVEPLLASLAHYVLLHGVARLLTRADLVPLVIAWLQLLLQVVVVCPREVHVNRYVGHLLKVLQGQDATLAVDALNKDVVEVLGRKDLLDADLLLVLLTEPQLFEVQVALRVVPREQVSSPEAVTIGL